MKMSELGEWSKASANRVIRGGSWNSNAQNVRAAYRNWNSPENRNNNLGFRCRTHMESGWTPREQTTHLSVCWIVFG
ncbi:MAG: SUMF1/EgtB/PvdO family nonheme iron enzyme [Rhodopirellula sp.]|nr:SUMF1/EgtB/PvdO family nonheme iron enzyme [Rhodopirellula sp.]